MGLGPSGGAAGADRRLPLRWEVCSGVGEWAAAQAAADAGRANWLAAELRYDRSRAALLQPGPAASPPHTMDQRDLNGEGQDRGRAF